MAIERYGAGQAGLARRVGLKAAKNTAKKGAKHVGEKHAGKKAAKKDAKHAAKKGAKHVPTRDELMDGHDSELDHAFHHLHRAAAVISLLEKDSGGDLRMLMENGMELYRNALGARQNRSMVRCAHGLLRAAEHLSMAGLYEARSGYRVEVAPPSRGGVSRQLRELGPRLDGLGSPERENARRLCSMARELLHRAERAGHDPHLEYELVMAAEGICVALEEWL